MANPALKMQGNTSSTCYLFYGQPSLEEQENTSSTRYLFYGQPSPRETGKYQFYMLFILWSTQF